MFDCLYTESEHTRTDAVTFTEGADYHYRRGNDVHQEGPITDGSWCHTSTAWGWCCMFIYKF